MSQSEFEKHLHIQTGPLPWPLTLQWACGLLVWAGRTNLLKASTSTRFHGEGRKGVGLATGHLIGFLSKGFSTWQYFLRRVFVFFWGWYEFVVLSSPLENLPLQEFIFFQEEKKHIYIASPFLNCASLAKEFHSDSDAMNGAVIMGFRRAQSPTTGIVPLMAELELCLL